MPRQAATTIENSFIGGFNTQGTGLNFPENAAFDQDNCIFSERGIASRRPGFEFENNSVTHTSDRTDKAQVAYLWKNVAGNGNTNLVVHQQGGTLFFFDTGSSLSLSSGISANSVLLSSFQSAGSTTANVEQNECQFSTGLGYLFVVHPYCDPFYIQYNSSGGTFTASIINLTVRDVSGIDETGNVDNRPAALTDIHKYNLLNQGWDTTKIGTFHTAASAYPSNADVWWIFKNSTDIFDPATTLTSNSRGSSPASQGYFRLSPWSTAREAIALAQSAATLTLSGVDETSGALRPSVTEFHAGRVFYAGVNAQGYNARIYFSKIIEKTTDFGSCMSENDPTSETAFDFLPSDGGVISIPQAGTVYRLVSLGATLLVFGANGVWAVSGSQGIGFTATDFSISNVGYTRSISGTSFVVADGSVAWWNSSSINIITNDPQKGLSISSMTDDKIKDFYIEIDGTSKRFARGQYNPRTHTIEWLYRTDTSADITTTYTFDSVLAFNTLVSAFYTWTIPTDVTVNSVLVIEGVGSLVGSDNVVDNSAVQVVDNLGNNVITFGFSQTTLTTSTKYLVSYPDSGSYKFTFAETFNTNYLDWEQQTGGVDYDSFFTTGYRIKTQGQRNFQSNYIFIFSDLEDGVNSYAFQSLWDYANTGDTGRWSQTQLVLHDDLDYDVARRRLKVRGQGEAVQFKFKSVTGRPFNIIGWSTYDTSNANP